MLQYKVDHVYNTLYYALLYLFCLLCVFVHVLSSFVDGPDILNTAIEITAVMSSNPPAFQLTCTSSTAPATTVQWSKDGSPVSGGSSSQIVTDTVEATYINELTVTGGQSGTYTCTVTTWRAYRDDDSNPDTMVGSSATASITVEGILTLHFIE